MSDRVAPTLASLVGRQTPGLQYVAVDATTTLAAHAMGLARIAERQAMTMSHTMMAYSMTKTFTAIAVLQLVEAGRLGLDDAMDQYVPDTPYANTGITIRHLLTHTAGLPNPIPLRWVHLVESHTGFDEATARREVLRAHPRLVRAPGERFAYTNIGHWLLGAIVERVSGMSYAEYVRSALLDRLGVPATALDFTIPDPSRHANGYLAKYSVINLLKGFVTDRALWGGYEGRWLRLEPHHLNGPAFGGLVGTAHGIAALLQDQLRPESVLLSASTKQLLDAPQFTRAHTPIPMTLGWHIGRASDGLTWLFKEGGGGGFHSEMRLYPAHGVGTVIIVNSTTFHSARALDRIDRALLVSR
ncbi:MAG: beta-lactamase family protein [Gemmatimonadaceae bacterium]|jgi:CubicO group peptidase (beta-lactamase class C family)|nr:beta-lactamase family protein [Gemmatimonadaceae bacterium]